MRVNRPFHRLCTLGLAGMVGVAFGLFPPMAATANAPVKGAEVRLGKNPGGGATARTTDAQGHASFGTVPAGQYQLTVDLQSKLYQWTKGSMDKTTARSKSPGVAPSAASAASTKVTVEVRGAKAGTITRTIDVGAAGMAAARAASAAITFETDGTTEVTVTILAD
jgi:hypothetical protein